MSTIKKEKAESRMVHSAIEKIPFPIRKCHLNRMKEGYNSERQLIKVYREQNIQGS